MNISIQEKSFRFDVRYEIELPTTRLTAKSKFVSVLTHLELYSSSDDLLATISGEASLTAKFQITLTDDQIYEFAYEKFWKNVFTCQSNGDTYRLYQHKGLNYSIFKENTQVAAFTKDRLNTGTGNTYDISVNSDANINLVICMVLAINTVHDHMQDGKATIVNYGSLVPEDRPFDKSWRPNDSETT